jgi:hypothetical protein
MPVLRALESGLARVITPGNSSHLNTVCNQFSGKREVGRDAALAVALVGGGERSATLAAGQAARSPGPDMLRNDQGPGDVL